ncbi:hypothetical protein CFC21_036286 [Triticum aestivum]|uniref:Uncharacterized protein n=2 Tax=Triticum aestivum TaxID=4565 RepID=A0A3B6EK03_WHEAT|nr:uncharacterized protein LOC119269110 [Triticum dicoccoides]XP_044341469.1 uncharacterized protein LOC123062163 isoform X1 [Triticum aestivum]KAF7023855.1 hypothetical protein CFC21_036286 [Triticum aestivum]
MDLPKRALPQGSPRRSPRAMEGDENAAPRRPAAAGPASPQRKKVLGVRNGAGRGQEGAASAAKAAALATPPPTGGGAGTYDPKTNYTTPRPDFLRYDPKRSREIILRLGREVEGGDSSSATSGTELSEVLSSGSSAARGGDSECDDADDEEEVVPAQGRGGRWARRLLLLLVSSACLLCYIYCMSSAPFPATTSEEPVSFVGFNGSMSDVGVHEVVPLPGPIQYEHEADIGQSVVGGSDDGIPLHGPGASPSNFMAVAMVGMADACPNVAFGEFTCQIGDESSEILDVLNEDSGIGELKSEASMRPLENAEESSEVVCSGGDVTEVPFGSTHSDDMDENKLGLVPQETGGDESKQSMPQLVTMDEILESESVKVVSDDKGLETERLDQEEFDSLGYENTAEGAKKLVDMVKILWSAVEPHLLKMLACLSVAGLVTVMIKYSQRSRKVKVPVSQRMPSVPPRRVPVLAPHNTVPLPAFHSEQPVQRIVPKQESSACLEPPMQSLLSESDQSVCLNVPSSGHRDHDQKVQQEDGGGVERASDGSTVDQKDTDRSKPPVVQLLGEFSFVDADSSRRRSAKDSIQHGGDVTVQESMSSRKRVVKTQKDSDKMQTPGLQAARKKETARAEEEKVDATPTPLRRSNRLRKLASP